MMTVTEAVARQLLCPTQQRFCQASGCMAWRLPFPPFHL